MSVDRRRQIIDAATKSFSMFGYKATTMDQVAKLANVGKGTIYTFFKNKDELFHDIVSVMVKEMILEAEDAINPDESFGENVHAALYRILEFRSEHQLMLKLLQEEKEMGTLAVLEMLNHIENQIIEYLKTKIETAQKKGLIREADSEITAFLFLRTYIALVSDWERRHKPLSSEKIAEVMKIYILEGLSK
ncbi:TetR/AcrR family transcriptional regulator [Bacillus sp. FJAT-42376]|uniref:TetR/AcrR family transcriptional regulator n=1 Tax=Bacillus sp. FJAT-42376 TaxID=2014076 RepID=UPI000F50273F|nr:TetR/AcrR family transcriptional regulator [Bacillus sp. FJAT-42376]AZB42294.1 TetR/AcrR family transcriptional regulator [Bacillus sp. FJAT-42376]